MPSKLRLRIAAAAASAAVVVLTPQLATAGGRSSSAKASSSSHRHRHHHGRGHHGHHHHTPRTAPTVNIPTSTTTTSTTTRPPSTPIMPVTPPPVADPPPIGPPPPVSPPPVSPPPVVGASTECLTRTPRQTVSGPQADRFKPSLGSPTAVDARAASWSQVDDWPVSITGSGALCWNGGSVVGTYATSTTWDTFHHTGAFSFANPGSIVEAVRIHNYGDGINVREGAADWRIRGVHETLIHDDCVQDDYLYSGVIEDSLFDGCYVGISTRASSSNTTSDGHANTLTLASSLLRLQPMPTVYKGPAPGHGGFFKWDNDAKRSPKLVLRNNVLRVDQTPNHGSLGLPQGYDVACSGNTIVWLGSGAFPAAADWLARCPDTKIVTSAATWDGAVAAWRATH